MAFLAKKLSFVKNSGGVGWKLIRLCFHPNDIVLITFRIYATITKLYNFLGGDAFIPLMKNVKSITQVHYSISK